MALSAAVTLTTIVLVTLQLWPEVACKSCVEKQEPATLSSLSTRRTDTILVSFKEQWKETNAMFSHLFDGTVTTWHVPNRGLLSYLQKNQMQGKRTIVVVADSSTPLESLSELFDLVGVRNICVTWLFMQLHYETQTYMRNSLPTLPPCQVVGLLRMNGTYIKSILWPLTLSVSHNPSVEEVRFSLKIESPNLKHLSGQRLTVVCLEGFFYGIGQDSCGHLSLQTFLQLLREANVSVNTKLVSNIRSYKILKEATVANIWDLLFFATRLQESDAVDVDFAAIFVSHATFYSRVNDHRVVTLSEVVHSSWRLFASVVALLLVVAVVLAEMEDVRHASIQSVADRVMLLVAAVLATSVPEPGSVSRRATAAVALHYLWFLAILPLSSYFRSELTSKVTLRQPGDRIDTLRKLEDALESHEVAPCCTYGSAMHDDLRLSTSTGASLMSKLHATIKHHGPKDLVKRHFIDCLRCAMRPDRVCYDVLEQPCDMRHEVPEVRVFKEHYKVLISGFPMHKSLAQYRPLRRFFLAIQEGRLIKEDYSECSHGEISDGVEFDLGVFLLQYGILQVFSCVVLVIEILVARCSQCSLVFSTLPWEASRRLRRKAFVEEKGRVNKTKRSSKQDTPASF